MALTGPKPREDRSQIRFKGSVAEWTEIEDVPFDGAPALPERSTGVDIDQASDRAADEGTYCPFPWPTNTLRWYRTMSTMPHAVIWTAADWEFVFETAEVHARFTEGWKGTAASELRQRVKLLGGYADALRDLRIRYIDPKRSKTKATGTDTAAPAGVSRMSDYRNL